MTAEIEKNFFDTFGIEPFIYCSKPRLDCDARNKGLCRKDCEYYSGVLYPEITDRILLRLICLLSSEFGDKLNIKTLKKRMMQESMCCYTFKGKLNEKFKQKVRTLFKEYE